MRLRGHRQSRWVVLQLWQTRHPDHRLIPPKDILCEVDIVTGWVELLDHGEVGWPRTQLEPVGVHPVERGEASIAIDVEEGRDAILVPDLATPPLSKLFLRRCSSGPNVMARWPWGEAKMPYHGAQLRRESCQWGRVDGSHTRLWVFSKRRNTSRAWRRRLDVLVFQSRFCCQVRQSVRLRHCGVHLAAVTSVITAESLSHVRTQDKILNLRGSTEHMRLSLAEGARWRETVVISHLGLSPWDSSNQQALGLTMRMKMKRIRTNSRYYYRGVRKWTLQIAVQGFFVLCC